MLTRLHISKNVRLTDVDLDDNGFVFVEIREALWVSKDLSYNHRQVSLTRPLQQMDCFSIADNYLEKGEMEKLNGCTKRLSPNRQRDLSPRERCEMVFVKKHLEKCYTLAKIAERNKEQMCLKQFQKEEAEMVNMQQGRKRKQLRRYLQHALQLIENIF